jgi:hypothetical protein
MPNVDKLRYSKRFLRMGERFRLIVFSLLISLVAIGTVAAFPASVAANEGCVFVATEDEDADDEDTYVYIEEQSGDYSASGYTDENSECPADDRSEDSFESYLFTVPAGDHDLLVYQDSGNNAFWGLFEVTVTEGEMSVVYANRGAVYSTSTEISSPRDSTRFQPDEQINTNIRIYNGHKSGGNDFEISYFVHDPNEDPTSSAARTTGYLQAERSDQARTSFRAPGTEGEYEVSARIRTETRRGTFISDYVDLGRITVEEFEPPRIENHSPSDSALRMTPDENQRFSVQVTDPDSSESDITRTWYVDNQEIRSGQGFDFEASRYGGGEHTVGVVVSDETRETDDAVQSWTVEVIEAPTINDISPGGTEATVGDTVDFSIDASDPGGYTPLSYSWKINGETFNGRAVSYKFGSEGTYTVQATVTNSEGVSADRTFEITVDGAPPEISATADPSQITAGESVQLSATATDPANRETGFTYDWNVGGETLPGDTVEITPTSVGEQTITVEVTNDFGTSATKSVTLSVNNDEPEVDISSPDTNPEIIAGSSRQFSVDVSNEDASAAEVRLIIDGQREASKTISNSRQVSFSREFTDPGNHNVEIEVEDAHGASETASWQVGVESRPPEFNTREPEEAAVSIKAGETVEFNVAASDPDGEGISYRWLIDGSSVGTGNQHTEQFNQPGDYNVTVVASDPQGKAASRSWSVGVSSFREPPQIDPQITTTSLDPDGKEEFVTVSVQHPSVNERNVETELIIRPPDGITVSSTRNIREGDPSQFVGYDTVSPGSQTSITISLDVNDDTLVGETLAIDYRVIYFPSNQRESFRVVDNRSVDVTVGSSGQNNQNLGSSADGAGFEWLHAIYMTILAMLWLGARNKIRIS